MHLREWEKAKMPISVTAKGIWELTSSLPFTTHYGSVADFEAKHGVEVPEDIASTLEPRLKLRKNSSGNHRRRILTQESGYNPDKS